MSNRLTLVCAPNRMTVSEIGVFAMGH